MLLASLVAIGMAGLVAEIADGIVVMVVTAGVSEPRAAPEE
jgi:hypothetical protein